MKKIAALLSLLAFSAATHATPPSEESINRLLNDLHTEKIIDAIKPQMDAMMRQAEQQATHGKTASPDEQKVLDKFHAKVMVIMNDTLSMDKLMPLYMRIYSENFTQEEVDGLVVFLESPAGKAYVNKLPVVIQAIMADLPKMMAPMTQKIQQAGKEMADELVALHKQDAKQ